MAEETTYRGRPLSELSKDELIAALNFQIAYQAVADKNHEEVVRLLSHSRPRGFWERLLG